MAPLEDERGRIHLNRRLVGLARREQFGLSKAVVIPGTHNAVGDVEIHSVREVGVRRVHVHEFGRDI